MISDFVGVAGSCIAGTLGRGRSRGAVAAVTGFAAGAGLAFGQPISLFPDLYTAADCLSGDLSVDNDGDGTDDGFNCIPWGQILEPDVFLGSLPCPCPQPVGGGGSPSDDDNPREDIDSSGPPDCPVPPPPPPFPDDQLWGETASDPIDFGTGDFVHHQTDLFIPGRSLPLEFKRTYHSSNNIWAEWRFPQYLDDNTSGPTANMPVEGSNLAPFGTGWTHNYFSFVQLEIDRDELDDTIAKAFDRRVDRNPSADNGPEYYAAYVMMNGRVDRFLANITNANGPDNADPAVLMDTSTTIPQQDPTVTTYESNLYPAVLELKREGTTPTLEYISGDGTVYEYELCDDMAYLGGFRRLDVSGTTPGVVVEDQQASAGTFWRLKRVLYRTARASTVMPADKANHGVTIRYMDDGSSTKDDIRIKLLRDSLGNQVHFEYGSTHHDFLITAMNEVLRNDAGDVAAGTATAADRANRRWEFEYAQDTPWVHDDDMGVNYVLAKVSLPEIGDQGVGAFQDLSDEHQRFDGSSAGGGAEAGPRSWQYDYQDIIDDNDLPDGNGDRPVRWTALSKITDPNGNVVTENEYLAHTDGPLGGRPYIARQIHGTGEYNYVYMWSGAANPIDLHPDTDPVRDMVVWVNSRRGQVFSFEYDFERAATGQRYVYLTEAPYGQDFRVLKLAPRLIRRREFKEFAPAANMPSFRWKGGGLPLPSYLEQVAGALPSDAAPNFPSESIRVGATETNQYWETVYGSFNRAWLPTAVEDAETGDRTTTQYGDVGFNAGNDDPRTRMMPQSRSFVDGSDPTNTIDLSWEYAFGFGGSGAGGCCGADFATLEVDGEGNITISGFDIETGDLLVRASGIAPGTVAPNTWTGTFTDRASAVTAALAYSPLSIESWAYNEFGQVTEHHNAGLLIDSQTVPGTLELHRRIDKFEYETNTASPSFGRLVKKTIDFGGEALVSEFAYDAVGNRTYAEDPLGHATTMVYNQDNQIVRRSSWRSDPGTLVDVDESGAAALAMAQTDMYYDANGNLVASEVWNGKQQTGSDFAVDSSNPTITTLHEYDILNSLTFTARERGVVLEGIDGDGDPMTPAYFQPSSSTTANGFDVRELLSNGDKRTKWVFTENVYDGNQNLVEVVMPEAVKAIHDSMKDASNRSVTIYDERDQPYRRIQGADPATYTAALSRGPIGLSPADVASIEGELVSESVFDSKRRLVQTIVNPDGIANPSDIAGGGGPGSANAARTSTLVYDAFNRVTERIDEMGNRSVTLFDANSNPLRSFMIGQEIDVVGSTGEVVLSFTEYDYDDLDRKVVSRTAVFIAPTAVPSDSELQPSFFAAFTPTKTKDVVHIFNENSSIHEIQYPAGDNPGEYSGAAWNAASGAATFGLAKTFYDSMYRVQKKVDAAGNEVGYIYDADSRVTREIRRDKRPSLSDEIYETAFEYDELHRRTAVIQGSYVDESTMAVFGPQNRSEYVYDSRGNVLQTTDSRGNKTASAYDSMNRLISSTEEYDGSGVGFDQDIVTATAYDESSRITMLTDQNGSSTSYAYDGMSREIKRIMADGTAHETSYTSSGPVYQTLDARGVKVTHEYDGNDRLVSKVIDTSSANVTVGGHSNEKFAYDGLGRLVEGANDFSRVTRSYDSRSLLTREVLNAEQGRTDYTTNSTDSLAYSRVTEYDYDLAGNNTLMTYAGDQPATPTLEAHGRRVQRTYDLMNRVERIQDPGTPANPLEFAYYQYVGAGRVHAKEMNNGIVRTEYFYGGHRGEAQTADTAGVLPDGGYAFGQVIKVAHTSAAETPALFEARSFTWDPSGNKTSHNDARATPGRERTFTYDSFDRLLRSTDGTMDAAAGSNYIEYEMDGVHNRSRVAAFQASVDSAGPKQAGAALGDYAMWSRDDLRDAAMNQYTRTPSPDPDIGMPDLAHRYDDNGNLILTGDVVMIDADFDGNNVINISDLFAFINGFTADPKDPSTDFNNDGIINISDQFAFINNFTGMEGAPLYYVVREYDYRNQLVKSTEFNHPEHTSRVGEYTYDVFNRRIRRDVRITDAQDDVIEDRVVEYVYGGQVNWQILEEREWDRATGSGELEATLHKSYVYGNYVDEAVAWRNEREAAISADDFFFHADDLFSVYAITDENGNPAERYEYGDFGKVSVLSPSGSPIAGSAPSIMNDRLFHGREFDIETDLYNYRHRYFDCLAGRFIQRDPMGYVDGANLFAAFSSRPLTFVDPGGTDGGILSVPTYIVVAVAGVIAAFGMTYYACLNHPPCAGAIQAVAGNYTSALEQFFAPGRTEPVVPVERIRPVPVRRPFPQERPEPARRQRPEEKPNPRPHRDPCPKPDPDNKKSWTCTVYCDLVSYGEETETVGRIGPGIHTHHKIRIAYGVAKSNVTNSAPERHYTRHCTPIMRACRRN